MFKNVTFDSGVIYSDTMYINHLCTSLSIGLHAVGTAVGTIELQTPVIPGRPSLGWVTLTAAHGWDGFPAGDLNGNFSDSISLNNVGHSQLRLKLTHVSGSSVLNGSYDLKLAA